MNNKKNYLNWIKCLLLFASAASDAIQKRLLERRKKNVDDDSPLFFRG
jgi:hypothetical protein